MSIKIKNEYFILVEDVHKSFNINMHSHECFAYTLEEAIQHMLINRIEFKNRKVYKIESFNYITKKRVVEYLDKDYTNSIDLALKAIKQRNELFDQLEELKSKI